MKSNYNSPKIMRTVKLLWLVVITVSVSVIIFKHHTSLSIYLNRLSWPQIGVAFLFIVLAKLLMAGVTFRALQKSSSPVTFKFSFYAYHITQLPKYVPGSVWQHIGRAYIYGEYGIPRLLSLNIIIFENFWLVTTSIFLGSAIVVLGNAGGYFDLIWPSVEFSGSTLVVLLLLIVLAIIILAVLIWITKPSINSLKNLIKPDAAMICYLFSVWIALGLSMYALLSQGEYSVGALTYTVGIFALGYGVGFMVPIAPAGLGIRESVMMAGFIHIAPTLELGVVFAIHRLLYLVADLTFTVVAYGCTSNPRQVSQPSI